MWHNVDRRINYWVSAVQVSLDFDAIVVIYIYFINMKNFQFCQILVNKWWKK